MKKLGTVGMMLSLLIATFVVGVGGFSLLNNRGGSDDQPLQWLRECVEYYSSGRAKKEPESPQIKLSDEQWKQVQDVNRGINPPQWQYNGPKLDGTINVGSPTIFKK
jgi:hypothetical protein